MNFCLPEESHETLSLQKSQQTLWLPQGWSSRLMVPPCSTVCFLFGMYELFPLNMKEHFG